MMLSIRSRSHGRAAAVCCSSTPSIRVGALIRWHGELHRGAEPGRAAGGPCLQCRGPVAATALPARAAVAEFGPSPAPAPQPPPWDAPPHDAAQLAEYREVMGALAHEVEQHRQALVTWQQAVAERERDIATVTDERNRFADDLTHAQAARDRYQVNGKQYKARSAQSDCLLQFAAP